MFTNLAIKRWHHRVERQKNGAVGSTGWPVISQGTFRTPSYFLTWTNGVQGNLTMFDCLTMFDPYKWYKWLCCFPLPNRKINKYLGWSSSTESEGKGGILIGGFKHEFYFPSYMGCHPSHWRTHIFQRGRSTTNQHTLLHLVTGSCCLYWRVHPSKWLVTLLYPVIYGLYAGYRFRYPLVI